MSKVLVAYFSVSGVTRRVAENLARVEEADLFEIAPETPYTAEDLDWKNKESRSSVEMADPNSRPAMKGPKPDLSAYEVIFLGFPIWWNREPSIVDTFLDGTDFTGKMIVPFCTSGGSGLGATTDRLNNLIGRKGQVIEGKRMGGMVSMEDLKTWSDGLDL